MHFDRMMIEHLQDERGRQLTARTPTRKPTTSIAELRALRRQDERAVPQVVRALKAVQHLRPRHP